MKNTYYIMAATLLFTGVVVAQEKDQKKEETIGTEVVDVVRAYDASISDAFKVREQPNLDEEADIKKKNITYTINSFPVVSTFVPEKGRAAEVEKEARLKAFDNYVLFGAGRYVNLMGELFLSGKVNETDYIAGFAKHFSSQGGVKNVLLDDNFSTSSAEISYRGLRTKWNWNLDLGGEHQIVNWYGLPVQDYAFTDSFVDNIDPQQVYRTVYLGGTAAFSNAPITEVEVQYKRFWDEFDSKENRFYFKPTFQTSLGDTELGLKGVLDYVGTDYENFQQNTQTSYRHLNIGLEPHIKLQGDDYSLTAGVGLYFNNGEVDNSTKNNFYIYPQVKASFKLVHDILVTYMGAEGGLKQNSYADFVKLNPFIAPELMITPTSQQYNLYVGLKGKLDNSISYNVKGALMNEDDKAFFVSNALNVSEGQRGYEFGNSFGVVYESLKTYNIFGELRFDFEDNLSVGLFGEFNHYSTDLKEAWNMPKSVFGADIQMDFTDKWFAGLEVNYVGERKDRFVDYDAVTSLEELSDAGVVKSLDGYADFNVKLGYRPATNWTLFIHGNNLLNKNYEHWGNFKVQGIQVMGGAMYKFDF